jgi:putative redox protein
MRRTRRRDRRVMTLPVTQPSSSITPAIGPEDGGGWVAATVGPSGFRAEITARTHRLLADEPVALGGTDAGPTPYEYLLGALAGCTAMTIRMYADRKGWPVTDVRVELRTSHSHERDCESCATEKVGMGHLDRRVVLEGPITAEQRERLLQIADRCPVKQTLEQGLRVQRVE